MDLHKCVVKLRSGGESGIFTGEVPKDDLTTPEILILQQLHGEDAVVQIERTGTDRRNDRAERERLASLYNNGNRDIVGKLFGPTFNPLPKRLSKRDGAEPAADAESMV